MLAHQFIFMGLISISFCFWLRSQNFFWKCCIWARCAHHTDAFYDVHHIIRWLPYLQFKTDQKNHQLDNTESALITGSCSARRGFASLSIAWELEGGNVEIVYQMGDGLGYQNGWFFGKLPKGEGGVLLNPKIYVTDFEPFYRAFWTFSEKIET